MKICPVLIVVLMTALSVNAEPRVWTAKDGRTINAEYISSTANAVTVRRQEGSVVTIQFSLLSDEDVTWISHQPKPVEITQDQLDKITQGFPKPPALKSGEVTNDLKQMHDKYLSMVKFIRPNTIAASLKMIRAKIEDDIKVLNEIAKTNLGDNTGKRGSGQSQQAENGIVSARRGLSWLQVTFPHYLQSFDDLLSPQK